MSYSTMQIKTHRTTYLVYCFLRKVNSAFRRKWLEKTHDASYDPEAWACWYVLAPYSKGLSHFSPVHSKGPDFIPRSRKGFLQVPMYPGTLRVSNDIQSFLWHQLRGGFRGQTMYLRPPSTSAGVAVSIVLVFNKIDGICPLQSQVEEDLSVCLTSNGGRICICQSTTVGSEAVLKRQPARVFAV